MKNNFQKPSRFAEWVLKILVGEYKSMLLMDEFNEIYNVKIKEKGKIKAYLWFWSHFTFSLIPIIKRNFIWSIRMYQKYLKIAFKHISKNKVYSFINLFGLAAGIACTILIYLFIKDELSFDKFHKNGDKIYRLTTNIHNPDGSIKDKRVSAPLPHGSAMKEFFPEVKNCVRIWPQDFTVKYENLVEDHTIYFADKDFFSMFTFPLEEGDPSKVLTGLNSMVLSNDLAKKYFGEEDPIGKTISVFANQSGINNDFVVTGIFKSPPSNSTLTAEIIINLESLKLFGWEQFLGTWQFIPSGFSFIEVKDKNSETSINDNFDSFINQYWSPYFKEMRKAMFKNVNSDKDPMSFGMQKLENIHLDPEASGSPDLTTILILTAIAITVLFIACVNFITLSAANASKRIVEIGIRKVVGAGKKELIQQFWSEAFLMTGFAVILGIGMVYFMLPLFNIITLKTIKFSGLLSLENTIAVSSLTLIVGILVGSYPAFVMSGIKTVDTFKGKLALGRKNIFTKVLVVTQFTLSIVLFITAIVLGRQISFLINSDHGFSKDNIVYVELKTKDSDEAEKMFLKFRDRLLDHPGIIDVSGSAFTLPQWYTGDRIVYDGETFENIGINTVYHNYLKTLGIEITDGRDFSPDLVSDKQAVVVNETLVRLLEIENPIGKNIEFHDETYTINGVAKDFHLRELRYGISPAVFTVKQETGRFALYRLRYLLIKTTPEDISGTLGIISNIWKELQPDKPLDFSFLDENIKNMYNNEKRWNNIVIFSSALAILIACLGVFGLTSISIRKRTKEIGIRKVHGASISDVMALLSKESVKYVLISNVIAWPVAWFFMNKWLQNFAFKISISPLIFLTAALSILILVFTTTCIQVYKAARANPA
ncbi:ABC transporter permease, partial [candidate division KSB1 bacterium]